MVNYLELYILAMYIQTIHQIICVNGERGPHLAKSWKQVGLCKGFTGLNCFNFQNEKPGNIKEAQISTIICSEEIEKGNKQDQASQISPS